MTALKAVNINSALVEDSELNAEGGCLIYSVDIQSHDKKSFGEVVVDAGIGKVLAVQPSSAMAIPSKKVSNAGAKP